MKSKGIRWQEHATRNKPESCEKTRINLIRKDDRGDHLEGSVIDRGI
jgi:hypothetical protein